MKDLLILFITFAVVVQTISFDDDSYNVNAMWSSFKKRYRKRYGSTYEEYKRKVIFARNLRDVVDHNTQFDNGQEMYQKKIYNFADLTSDEVTKFKKGLIMPPMEKRMSKSQASAIILPNLPASINWVTKGVVTSIKDQGFCGGCWAFTVVAAIESQMLMKNVKTSSKIPDLSEQQMIDCARGSYMSEGCNGGWPYASLKYVIDKNITTEASYPYASYYIGSRSKCKFRMSLDNYRVRSQTNANGDLWGNEEDLRRQLTFGPVIVLVTANDNFITYSSGIFSDPKCKNDPVDHVVLLVGYEIDPKGIPYWLVKNSWGTEWGEKGYIRMIRNGNSTCNIAEYGSVPIL